MPLEILWEDPMFVEDDFDCNVQAVRFRRPQLIDPMHIASVFNELLARLVSMGSWRQVTLDKEHTETITQEPSWPQPNEGKFWTTKKYSFPLRIVPCKESINYSSISIIHNIPVTEEPIMGSCTWSHHTQPLTRIELKIDTDWLWPVPFKNRDKEMWHIAWNLYWRFRDWINMDILAEKLTKLGYELTPQFDPNWIDYVIEDQCQECGKIVASMPFKQGEFKVGKTSSNICHCRYRRHSRNESFYSGIQRRFKIIGIYPISPEEAEHASYEAMMQADSAD